MYGASNLKVQNSEHDLYCDQNANFKHSGPGWSKLMTSLVNETLKFQT